MERIRLQRYLSQSGVAARRKAEQLIVAGRVKVNGHVVRELGTTVDPDGDRVQVDGEAVHPAELFYVVLNKPKGCITAVSDPEGRRTVMEYLPNLPVPIAPVGRLDFYSEGVLLLTNDGELSAALQSPKTHADKTYHVKVRGRVKENHLAAMRSGVRLEDGTVTRDAQVDRLRSESRHEWLVFTLTEGKSRQIHRMAEAFGYQVLKIQRVSFAGIDFHGLRVGDARELSQAEVNELRDIAGLPRSEKAVARGKWKARREDTELTRRAKDRVRPVREVPDDAAPKRDAGRPARDQQPGRGARDQQRDTGRGARDQRKDTGRGARGTGYGGPAIPRDRDRDRDRSRGPGPSRDRSRGPSRDRDRDRDRDRSRGPGPSRDRSRSPGPDRGRSPGPGPSRDRSRSAGPDRGRGRGPGPSRGPDRDRGRKTTAARGRDRSPGGPRRR